MEVDWGSHALVDGEPQHASERAQCSVWLNGTVLWVPHWKSNKAQLHDHGQGKGPGEAWGGQGKQEEP